MPARVALIARNRELARVDWSELGLRSFLDAQRLG